MIDSPLPPEVSLLLQSWTTFAPEATRSWRFLLLTDQCTTNNDDPQDRVLAGASPKTNQDQDTWWQQQTGKTLAEFLELSSDTPSDWLNQTMQASEISSPKMATVHGNLLDRNKTLVTLECSLLAVPSNEETIQSSAPRSYIMAKLTTAASEDERHSQFWHLHELAESSFDPVIMIDTQGMIVFANPAIQPVFGYTSEELRGRPMSLLCGSAHAHQHQSYVQRYVATGKAHKIGTRRQVQARHKDGHEFPVVR